MSDHLKILILEDSRDDVDLIERELKKSGIEFTSLVVNKKTEFESALRSFTPDVILSDHSLPQFNSIEALECYKTYENTINVRIPFILITGSVSEEFAVQCMRGGADDYILKDRLKRLPGSIKSNLEKCRVETERRTVLSQLIAKEALLGQVHRLMRIGVWEVDFREQKVTWDSLTRQLHEVESDFEPDMATSMLFFKEGESRDSITSAIDNAIQNGISWDLESLIVTAKGNERWIRSVGDAEMRRGNCVRLYGSILDIHKRKEAEETLKESYEEKIHILESIGDAFFAVDKQWIVTYWNNIAERKTGMPREHILGKNLWVVYADAIPLAFYTHFHRALTQHVTCHFQGYYPPLDIWFEVNVYPSAKGLSVYFKDITAQKKYLEQIETQNIRLREIAWTQSHEVRGPLARIIGLVNLITNYDDPGMDLKEVLNNIGASARELDLLIRKIVRKTEEIDRGGM